MTQRSTKLKLAERHCPRAVDHYEKGMHYDRDIFGAGIAAHAVLEAVQLAPDDYLGDVIERVETQLATKGRSFDGVGEPPMAVAAIRTGVDLAREWLLEHPPIPDAKPEVGMAVTKDWTPAKYGTEEAYYQAALDLHWVVDAEYEEYAERRLVVRDYKTSWRDLEGTLDSIQLRGQGLLALTRYEDIDVVELQVSNLRANWTYSKELYLDDEGKATLASWRRDIDLLIAQVEARDADGRRFARPGANCIGCPFFGRCPAAREVLDEVFIDTVTPGLDVDGAIAGKLFAVLDTAHQNLLAYLKGRPKDEPIPIPGGFVGYKDVGQQVLKDGALTRLAQEWFEKTDDVQWTAEHAQWLGLLAAMPPGKSAIEKVIRKLIPGRGPGKVADFKEKRAELMDELFERRPAPWFGVHRD